MKIYRWSYRVGKDGKITEGTWTTALPASQICKWFEDSGYEIIYLKRGKEISVKEGTPITYIYNKDNYVVAMY